MRTGGGFGVWLGLSLTLLAGCATPRAYLGDPISATHEQDGYRAATVLQAREADDLLFLVSLSGGGMRASAMAYGVLEQLAADSVDQDGRDVRLLDEVDLISAVSGGAVTAAYYVLYGDRLFDDFAERFLDRDVTAALYRKILLNPRSWWQLVSREYARGDAYAAYFDQQLFHEATFGDLDRSGARPFLIINATDVGLAARFEFTQDSFDVICSDLSRFPLARAVAASSLVPALLTPITLRNRAGSCGHVVPSWVKNVLDDTEHSTLLHFGASVLQARTDPQQFPYLHLVDGALSDNLGARAVLDALSDTEDRMHLRRASTGRPIRRLVYLSVNAGDSKSTLIGRSRQPPDALQMLRLMGTVPVDRYTAESKVRLREALEQRARELHAELHYVEIELEDLRLDPRFVHLVELPTSFDMRPDDVQALRCASRGLLAQSAEYQRLRLALGGRETSAQSLSHCKES